MTVDMTLQTKLSVLNALIFGLKWDKVRKDAISILPFNNFMTSQKRRKALTDKQIQVIRQGDLNSELQSLIWRLRARRQLKEKPFEEWL